MKKRRKPAKRKARGNRPASLERQMEWLRVQQQQFSGELASLKTTIEDSKYHLGNRLADLTAAVNKLEGVLPRGAFYANLAEQVDRVSRAAPIRVIR